MGHDPVGRGDDRERLQSGDLVLAADPHERPALGERAAQQLHERDALLNQRHQLVDLLEAAEAVRSEQPRGAVDIEDVLTPTPELDKSWREVVDESPLAWPELRVGEEPLPEHPRPHRQTAETLVEGLTGPRDRA